MSARTMDLARVKDLTALREKASEAILTRDGEVERLIEEEWVRSYLELRGL